MGLLEDAAVLLLAEKITREGLDVDPVKQSFREGFADIAERRAAGVGGR